MVRVVALALVALLASACNVILENEKRSLEAPALVVDGGDLGDAGPTGLTDGETPAGCGRGGRLPECAPGSKQEADDACGRCERGSRARSRTCAADCAWSAWSEWSQCEEPADICTPGERMEMTEPCGSCDAGTRVTVRVCTNECGWSEWMPGPCTVDAERCEPGSVESLAPVSCDEMCGKASQTRTCNAECNWDAPVLGECTGQGVCAPGTIRMREGNCNANYCNKGVQEQREICTEECTWAEPVGVGACTIPADVCRPPDLGGVGWRCRQDTPGFRETCRPASASEADRCTWAGNREPFNDC